MSLGVDGRKALACIAAEYAGGRATLDDTIDLNWDQLLKAVDQLHLVAFPRPPRWIELHRLSRCAHVRVCVCVCKHASCMCVCVGCDDSINHLLVRGGDAGTEGGSERNLERRLVDAVAIMDISKVALIARGPPIIPF